MALFLASLNVQGLRSESRKVRLVRDLKRVGANICCLQETHLIPSDYWGVLARDFQLFSAYYNSRSRGVSWLISRSMKADCILIYADPEGRLCVMDVTIKGKTFRFIGVYVPNDERESGLLFFFGIERRLVLAPDWNAVLDTNQDIKDQGVKAFRNFVGRIDLVNKFRYVHPRKIEL